ncbi:MAG: MBL fold metallo-hydrolase [Gemmataceae bacterium]|nr:MBL fold metallo-hydrolase [Gemmataceae bacterium]
MRQRWLAMLCCLALTSAAAWFGGAGEDRKAPEAWIEVAPGVMRTPGLPGGYALVDGTNALLIDAPVEADGLKATGVRQVEMVLLTHHHFDTCAAADRYLAAKVPVRAPEKSAEWLTPDGVRKHWKENVPLRHSRAAYFVAPVGLDGVACSLKDKQEIEWRGWTIQVIETPGHSRDHVAYAVRKGKDGALLLFCGDALASAGKMWTPYTTDWDHWTDLGLKPAGESLRKLAALKPAILLPAHGAPIKENTVAALMRTAEVVEEAGFLKSFERYTKDRIGNAPEYQFLAKEQAKSGGKLPWTPVSKNLFLTGNTYVLTSKDNAFLVVDPWGQLSADQIAKLRADRRLGTLEVVMFSHAHFDHYDGIYYLPERDKLQVWALESVAGPIADPFRLYAPFLDARPVKFDKQFKDGETAKWREYDFKFHYFPGQSLFSMAVETTIDGKKCLFTADNFFHQDMFSGSGGWMGLNRSFPTLYEESAKKVSRLKPEWVLAEHGGPFEFNAQDWERRERWAAAAGIAANALSPTGKHMDDWYPQRLAVEPVRFKAKPGERLKGKVVVSRASAVARKYAVTLLGRGLASANPVEFAVSPRKESTEAPLELHLSKDIPAGRHVFRFTVATEPSDQSDVFVIVDVDTPD